MLSGIGPKEELQKFDIQVLKELPVGKNHGNHVVFMIPTLIKDRHLSESYVRKLDQKAVEDLYINGRGSLAQFPMSLVFTNSKNNSDKSWPNTHVFALQVSSHHFIMLPVLVRAKSKGIVGLRSGDPFDPPIIDPKFLTHSQDMEDFVEVIKFSYFILKNTSFAKYVSIQEFLLILSIGCPKCPKHQPIYECDSLIRCLIKKYAYSFYHNTGTCSMGSTDRTDNVVDERLRVEDVYRLRVCDSSILPNPPNTNTNAASIMIGEKCSHMVLEDNS